VIIGPHWNGPWLRPLALKVKGKALLSYDSIVELVVSLCDNSIGLSSNVIPC